MSLITFEFPLHDEKVKNLKITGKSGVGLGGVKKAAKDVGHWVD